MVLARQHACLLHTGLPWGDQIRTITIPFADAKGPTNARHLAATLYRGEDYFMQIDSHTSFIQVPRHACLPIITEMHSGFLAIHYKPCSNKQQLDVSTAGSIHMRK